MSNPLYAILLVKSINHALRVEKILQAKAMTCKLIPVPRKISSDCGVCVRVPWAEGESVRQVLRDAGMDTQDLIPV